MHGHVAVLQFLRDANISLELRDKNSMTPVVNYGHLAALELLRDAEVNLEAVIILHGESVTSAFIAGQNRNVAVLKILRDAGVDLGANVTLLAHSR